MSIVIKEIQVHTSVEKPLSSPPSITRAQIERIKQELKKELLKVIRREISSTHNKER